MLEFKKREESFVDAIEDGKIVKVSEDYARREGLLILRKSFRAESSESTNKKKEEDTGKSKIFSRIDDFRKPLSSRGSEILKELVENFHWILIRKRKDRLLTRKKVADDIGESEASIKVIENGVLPADNFILINKLESYYGVSLRKNRVASSSDNLFKQAIDFARSKSSPEKAPEIEEIRVARTPKWVLKREGSEKREEQPEIEIIDEEPLKSESSENSEVIDISPSEEDKGGESKL